MLTFVTIANIEAERKAVDIRLRAERRAWELLKELATATPGGDYTSQEAKELIGNGTRLTPSPYREALERTGIPPRTATQYQQHAEIPTECRITLNRGLELPRSSRAHHRDVMCKVGKVSRFSEIGANLSHIDFNGVTLGVTFKVIKGKMPVYM